MAHSKNSNCHSIMQYYRRCCIRRKIRLSLEGKCYVELTHSVTNLEKSCKSKDNAGDYSILFFL